MAKRSTTSKPRKNIATRSTAKAPDTAAPGAMERQVLAFAEQLGYVAGSIQSKAGHVNRETLSRQVSGVRDGAKRLLTQLAREVATRVRRAPAPGRATRKARSGGTVDAPGKKHRKPAAPAPPEAQERARNARMRAATHISKRLPHARQG